MTLTCAQLVPAQKMYDFNQNLALQNNFTPASGTPAAVSVSDGGRACNWIHETNGQSLTLAVASPGPLVLPTRRSAVATGAAVSGIGDAAYSSSTGNVTRLDAFSAQYWIVVTSPFSSASDLKALVLQLIPVLPPVKTF